MRAGLVGLVGLTLAVVAGCVSSSIARDVEHVHELSGADALANVADAEVDPATSDDVRQMLQRPIDAETAVKIALLNNRDLRSTLRGLGVARGQLMQAGLLPNPVAELEVSPERNTQIEVRLEYNLADAVLAPLRASAERAMLEAERYAVAGFVVDLGYRTRVAFYRLDAALQRLQVAREVFEGFAASRDAAQAMFDSGNLRELDYVNEQAMYERGRVTVAQLELDAMVERERMQRLLGLFGTEAVWTVAVAPLTTPESPAIPDDIERKAMRASLELSEIRQRLEGLARRAGVTRASGWLPDLSVDVHALHGNPEEDSAGANPELRWGGGVSVGIPLFDRQQGTASALEAERDALLEHYYGVAIEIRSAARQARGRVRSAHQRARQYTDAILPAQQRVTRQTLLQYNAMQVGVFQLLQARRDELDVQLQHLDTMREYQSAVAELEALLSGRRVSAETRADNPSLQSAVAGAH